MLGSIVKKVFGSKSEKDVKKIQPYVGQINAEFDKLKNISDDELRGKTQEIKGIINKDLSEVDAKIKALKEKAETDQTLDIHAKEAVFDEIDNLEEERNKELEKVLMKVMPLAFAVVKETARRLSSNKMLRVTATEHDKWVAGTREGVVVEGDKAIWSNKWLAAGTEVEWNMVHYDVQLIGGIVLHQGKIAEMATGEGKTLVATLPAYLNALAERGVHIVTVNDYLAKRDSEWMAPLFEFHGMKVDCIDKHTPHSEQRKNAYDADITYGTNNEFGFDYLRDNMAKNIDELVQPKHHYAMVDEVDSVLVDDARTPLIISGPVPRGDEHEFDELKPFINKIFDEQKKVCAQFFQEAKKFIKDNNEKEAGLPLFRAFRGLPKSKPLIKLLSEVGMRGVLQKTENIYLAENQKKMPEADEPLFFTIEEKNNNVELTEKGLNFLSELQGDKDFFVLPDISIELDKVEKDPNLSIEEKVNKKDEILSDYSIKTQRIHSINQLLKSYTLFEKDTDYVVIDGKVKIVDEQTGRIMEGRRYSDGLHQAIEAKENCKVEDATQTYATVTLQNYFRMYHKLSGMTGTAETEAGEFWEIYKLDVVVIPTNRPIARRDENDKVFKTVKEKFNAVIDECVELKNEGRPILVGTTSVEISEILSRMLKMRGIEHQVLNAKQHAREADVVAEAGKPGMVTIATNMAGRGTDIKLTPESKAAGGLAIIGTERHESRRVDRQLRGRAGRQGDVGSSQFFVSLEDNLMRLFGSERISKIMDRLGLKEGEVIQHSMITNSITRAQKKVEENNFSIRKRLLEYDDVMNSQREVIYKKRRNALYGDRLELDVLNMIYEVSESIVMNAKANSHDLDNALESMKIDSISAFGIEPDITKQEIDKGAVEELVNKLFLKAEKALNTKFEQLVASTFPTLKALHEDKGDHIENIVIPFESGKKELSIVSNLEKLISSNGKTLAASLQKNILLEIIDDEWKDHLRAMDDLKQSVQNATYEQKDPLVIYKMEGYNLFSQQVGKINQEAVSFLYKSKIQSNDDEIQEARQKAPSSPRLNENKQDVGSLLDAGGTPRAPQAPQAPAEIVQPAESQKIRGRNERVSVQYADGTVKEDVKFKTVEEDIRDNKCVLIES